MTKNERIAALEAALMQAAIDLAVAADTVLAAEHPDQADLPAQMREQSRAAVFVARRGG